MVPVDYAVKSDALSVILASQRVKESAEVLPDVIVDFDEDRPVVTFEILHASKVIDPATVEQEK